MKKITFIIWVSCIAFSMYAQPSFDCSIKMFDDTASSFLNHHKYNIRYTVNDTDVVIMSYTYSYFEIKFPTGTWQPLISRINKSNIYPIHLTNCVGDDYLNLLSLFVEHDSLVNLFQVNPLTVYIRYHLKAKINGGPYSDFYSNIDSLVLPVAQLHDIQAISFIRSSDIDPMKLSEMEAPNGPDEFNQYTFISEHFPNAVVADMAKLIVFRGEVLQQCQSTGSGYIVPPSVKTVVVDTCNDLMISRSGLVREKASAFLAFINAQD